MEENSTPNKNIKLKKNVLLMSWYNDLIENIIFFWIIGKTILYRYLLSLESGDLKFALDFDLLFSSHWLNVNILLNKEYFYE